MPSLWRSLALERSPRRHASLPQLLALVTLQAYLPVSGWILPIMPRWTLGLLFCGLTSGMFSALATTHLDGKASGHGASSCHHHHRSGNNAHSTILLPLQPRKEAHAWWVEVELVHTFLPTFVHSRVKITALGT